MTPGPDKGFRVQDLGFRVWNDFRVYSLGFVMVCGNNKESDGASMIKRTMTRKLGLMGGCTSSNPNPYSPIDFKMILVIL